MSFRRPTLGVDLLLEAQDRYRALVRRHLLGRTPRKCWMRRREVVLIEELLTRLSPRVCVEWGSGYSTAYFPTLLPADSRWIAIEHDEAWARRVAGMVLRATVAIHYVGAPGVARVLPEDEPRFRDYIEYPGRFDRIDFALVDGRARLACVAQARSQLGSAGVVVLHDANRRRYDSVIGSFPHELLLRDWRVDEGGVWVGSTFDLRGIVDLERHRRLWRAVQVVGRVGQL